ncbi:MAG: PIN domain-containing protein [Planctomycetota bacterium]|jgi:predicted nucleic acid-binding protein
MSARVFVDTNILVYRQDSTEVVKQPIAESCLEQLWREKTGRISVQVLNEYFVTVTRKLSPGLSSEEAWSDVCALMAWEPVDMTVDLLKMAKRVQEVHSISWWDALIVAAAQKAKCDIIYSEDLSAGQIYAGVLVVNPFESA